MSLSADLIVQRVREKYARCSSYVDSGFATSTFKKDVITRFKTYFLKPNYFCFEWQQISSDGSSSPKYGIWSDGEHTRTRLKKLEVVPSLAIAVASASGGSQGTAHLIASLLVLRIGTASNLDELFRVEIEEEDKAEDLYVLAGRNRTFWISRSDYSIKKVENDFWSNAAKCELEVRENQLALKLNRPALSPEKERWVISYEFNRVSFQNNLRPSDFGLPWKG
jgi:hypothetical protein